MSLETNSNQIILISPYYYQFAIVELSTVQAVICVLSDRFQSLLTIFFNNIFKKKEIQQKKTL